MILSHEILLRKPVAKLSAFLRASREKETYCDIFSYEPLNCEEASLGNLYLLFEISNLPKESSHFLNLFASLVKREYYAKPQRGILESFETSLKRANAALIDFVHKFQAVYKNPRQLPLFNCLCLAVLEKNLYLTSCGNIRTLLFRQGNFIDIKQAIAPPQKSPLLNPFQYIISGSLEEEDKLIFSSARFFNFAPLNELKQIFGNSSPLHQYPDQIKKHLEEQPKKDYPLAALLIEIKSKTLEPEIISSFAAEEYITPPIALTEIFSRN